MGTPSGLSVINPDGSDLRELTNSPGTVFIPDTNGGIFPSPDGKQIAFVAERDAILLDANRGLSTNNIYVMNADGSDIRRLTIDNTTNQYGLLSWSPDGKKLAFDMSSETQMVDFFLMVFSL